MFQHEITNHEFEAISFARPGLRKISDGKKNSRRIYFVTRLAQHTDGQIKCTHQPANVRKQECVLAGSTSDFKNTVITTTGKDIPSDKLIQITSEIPICVVRA